jgi:hypothetical protein
MPGAAGRLLMVAPIFVASGRSVSVSLACVTTMSDQSNSGCWRATAAGAQAAGWKLVCVLHCMYAIQLMDYGLLACMSQRVRT